MVAGNMSDKLEFQSTPPARGATQRAEGFTGATTTFQSTPPARGAT